MLNTVEVTLVGKHHLVTRPNLLDTEHLGVRLGYFVYYKAT